MKENKNIKDTPFVGNSIGFLFDLDGVLIDSESTYSRIWGEINEEYPTGVENFTFKIKGTTLENILSTYYPDPKIQKCVEKSLFEREQKMKYSPTEGCIDLLKELQQRKIPVAMVTSSNDDKMKHLWVELPEFEDYFNTIVSGDDVTKSKPDPEGYLLGAKRLGADIRHSVVFEDSLQGVKAGRNSDAYVVGIRGTVKEDSLLPYCDMIIDNLSEIKLDSLLEILKNR